VEVMTNLEQSISGLVKRHGLVHFSVDYSVCTYGDDSTWFGVSMQWLDPTDIEHGRGVAHSSADTIAEALSNAVTSMLAKRGVTETIAEEALPELAA
jgi:coenzyme F420-reducing hydrogenase beta subunit